jgi:hypothetical protein
MRRISAQFPTVLVCLTVRQIPSAGHRAECRAGRLRHEGFAAKKLNINLWPEYFAKVLCAHQPAETLQYWRISNEHR